jgi:hypothetical protein
MCALLHTFSIAIKAFINRLFACLYNGKKSKSVPIMETLDSNLICPSICYSVSVNKTSSFLPLKYWRSDIKNIKFKIGFRIMEGRLKLN